MVRKNACLLQVAVAPGFIKPVSGVRGGLAKLVGNGVVVVSRGRQKRVAGPGLWVWNPMSVQECLERTLRPSTTNQTTTVNDVIMTTTTQNTKSSNIRIKNPLLDTAVRLLGRALCLFPRLLDVVD